MIFLDTHIIVWLTEGKTEKLSRGARESLNQESVALKISPLVKLELFYLYEKKVIKENPEDILSWLNKIRRVTIADTPFAKIIDEAIKISWTRDPFDRIIVAEAKINKARLVTADKVILSNFKRAVW